MCVLIKIMVKTNLLIGLIIQCFFFGGCGKVGNLDVVAETEEKHYQRAQRLLREGRKQEALSAFLKVVEKRRDASESHLEAGKLYADYIDDPLAAIYHYRKFLELKPDSKPAPMVHQLIESAKKMFARQLPGQPLGDQVDRLDLLDLLEEMHKDNAELKKQIAVLHSKLADAKQSNAMRESHPIAMNLERLQTMPLVSQPRNQVNASNSFSQNSQTRVQQPAQPSVPDTYKVVSGDSLDSISKKMYGTSGRYMDIFRANRDRMSSPDALRVGMVLRIP